MLMRCSLGPHLCPEPEDKDVVVVLDTVYACQAFPQLSLQTVCFSACLVLIVTGVCLGLGRLISHLGNVCPARVENVYHLHKQTGFQC